MIETNTIKGNIYPSQFSSYGFLFDLDGVLIDSEKEYTRIWEEIDREFASGVPSLATKIKGMTLSEIVDTYFPEPEKREKVPEMLYYLEGQMHYEWLPGAKTLLTTLQDCHIPTALVTSSNEIKMRHLREELPEAENFFTAIVTGDKVSKSKPDPEGYLLGASLLNRPPEKCVVFEDSLQGVKAGKSSGAFVIGVAGTLPSHVIAPFSNMVVNSLKEIDLLKLIPRI